MTAPTPKRNERLGVAVRRRTLLLGTAALLFAGGCEKDEERGAAGVGKAAPGFDLETLDHERFFLNDQRAKPVVLLFWNTTCEVCKRQMVELESLRKKMAGRRVVMATVCTDPENIDTARRMVSGLGLGFPTLLDRGGRVGEKYGVEQYPTTVVVTPDGKIGFFRQGYTEPLMRQLQGVIDSHQ